MKIVSFLCLAVLLAVLSSVSVRGQEMTADEQAVWKLEENYWKYVKEQDIEKYLELWDERFVGWPRSSTAPAGKANITDWMAPWFADSARALDFELKREAVRSFGDVVAAHYLVWYVVRDAQTGSLLQRTPVRITHTWQRHGDSWQIITGMSSPHAASE
jgi:ketosteroid isomerase-like protein